MRSLPSLFCRGCHRWHGSALSARLRHVLALWLLAWSLVSCAKSAEHRVSRSRPRVDEPQQTVPKSTKRGPSSPSSDEQPATDRPIQRSAAARVDQRGTLSITFFDIGQGDAALVVTPTGKRILIDGGPPEGTNALLSALAERQIDRLDLVLLSHPHLDHLAGLRRVVERIPIATYMDAGYESTSPPYRALLQALSERSIPVKQAKRGRSIDGGGGVTLLLLAPPDPFIDRSRSDVNANSVVVRLSYAGHSVLFTGDAEPETERWLLAQYGPGASPPPETAGLLAADVLKVAHHGGKYSSTATFLSVVRPQLAVISCAAVNDYGHPTPETLGRLEKVGARVLRTDQLGHITLRSRDGQAWEVDTQPATPESPHATPNPRSGKPAKDEL
ncbi:MAG: MBL fold metallo-hydrolase [Myxococcales bacterium]|nr:MBL fold metallo-hydrolase [Myxococcales bacterium]